MLYAAYGSNIWEEQMKKRCPGAQIFDRGIILDHRLSFCRVATVVPSDGDIAPALVWQITAEDEKMLDKYEGYPYKYTKQNLPLQINGEVISVMAYVMKDSSQIHPPSEEYYNRIEAGYEAQGFDLCVLEDALDSSYSVYYGEDHDYGQCSLFDDLDFTETVETVRSAALQEDELQKAFVIGMAFANYCEDISLSAVERKRVIDSILNNYRFDSGRLSLYNYADRYFQGLIESQDRGLNEYICSQNTILYAAYGTNMNLSEMSRRCPNSSLHGTAVVPGHELCFKGCADCVPKDGAFTPVVLWDIDIKDWSGLDSYEGYPALYKRVTVPVITSSGERSSAVMYQMTNKRELVRPGKDMYRRILQGYIENGIDTGPLEKALKSAVDYEKERGNEHERKKLR